MAEYIERNELLKDIEESVVITVRTGMAGYPAEIRGANKVIERIKVAPAADVVEVVRCKDCKWYKEGYHLAPNKFCFRLKNNGEYVGYNFSPDDFCSYGERKGYGKDTKIL